MARPSLPLSPAAVFRAPAISGAGTGKGLLARAISVVAFGQQPHAAALGDGNEFDKGLTAELLRGDPTILIDNLNRRVLRSPVLCTALSERPAMLRVLGASEMRPTNSTAFIAITGNALTIAEDLVRRVITIDVDAKCENPEQRKFAGNFLGDISCQRGELLAAALCIWRFGRQNAATLTRGQPLGGFEPWSQWVRDPLLTLGCQDPIARMSDLKSSDPDRVRTVEIFQSWWEHHEDGLVKASELADEVQALIVPGPKRTRQDVASRVAKLVGTQVGGFRLTSDKGRKGKGRWAALQYQLIQRAEDEASNEDADGSNKAEPQHADPSDNAIPKRPPASAGTDPFGLDDEAFAQVRASQHLFQIIGPELSAPCAQCGLNDGKVYLIRSNVGSDVRAHPLHQQCAPFYFKTRTARAPDEEEHTESNSSPTSDEPAEKTAEQSSEPPSDPIERWHLGFGGLDPSRDPCPGFRTNEWPRVHHVIDAFLSGPLAKLAADAGWTELELVGVDPEVGVARPNACGVLMTNAYGSPVTQVTPLLIRFANGLAVYKARLSVANSVAVWDYREPAVRERQQLARTPISESVTDSAEGEPGHEEPCAARRGRVQEKDGVFLHFCVECGRFGPFGYGVRLRAGQLGRWYCREHRPQGHGP